MTVKDLEGTYSIIGSNQNEDDHNYRGTLTLKTDEHNRIVAKWFIHNEQEQTGYGFYHANILVINFTYKGTDNKPFSGTVVYKCLTKDLLDGFWSEEYGDPNYLGTERCFRIEGDLELN
ncbi:hypothetical protein [Seonamhaeicola marinus]|uniref:Uncharacterized protein n=1 Tax=Seonamhaeicola marinus TaxID=1912246 RepID=A0A5D0I6R4_9FLAO|nr:hypothetical protein [Seonamhaeicola marinus]TYA78629.1 hypothetical protein FUA24_09765 [Seonamhaeicola marinus]